VPNRAEEETEMAVEEVTEEMTAAEEEEAETGPARGAGGTAEEVA
jgi:hypothetical protein